MKQKLLFLMTLFSFLIMGGAKCWADTDKLPTADGWKKLAELPSDVSGYYFAFVDKNNDLMLSTGLVDATTFKLFYKNSVDARLNPTFLFEIENYQTDKYVVKSVATGTYLYSPSGEAYNYQSNTTKTSVAEDCRISISNNAGVFRVQTYQSYDNGDYLGLWTIGNGYKDGEVLACNKTEANAASFYIYAIAKTDHTSIIKLPKMNSTLGTNNWNVSVTKVNSGNYDKGENYVEFFGGNVKNFTMSQTVNLPTKGKYLLRVQGLYRDGDNAGSYTAHENGTENLRAQLYAGTNGLNIKSVWSDAQKLGLYKKDNVNYGDWPSDYTSNSIYVPNSVDGAKKYFESGLYWNTLAFSAPAGNIEIGVKQSEENTSYWSIYNNFQMIYVGDDFVNTSFDTESLAGWTVTNDDNGKAMEYHGENNFSDGKYAQVYELQNGKTTSIAQTIADLPAGIYQVSCKSRARNVTNTFLYANDNKVAIKTDDAEHDYNVYVDIEEGGSLTIKASVTGTGTGGSWFAIDQFTLTPIDEFPAYEPATGKMNAEISQAQTDAKNTFDSNKTASNYYALLAAIEVANNSVAIYEKVADYNTKAANLDDAGQAVYAPTLEAYNNGTLTKDGEVEQAKEAYVAAVKAQTTDNADMTGAIVNPTPESVTKNADGWTINTTSGNKPFVYGQYFEHFNNDADNTFDYYQIIDGLPKGTYTVSASMYAGQWISNDNQNLDNCVGVYASALGAPEITGPVVRYENMEPITAGGTLSVIDGKIRIGVKNFKTRTIKWFHADDFHLTLVHKYTEEECPSQTNYTINAVDTEGNFIKEISSGTCPNPGTIYYPHAIEKDGTWYLTTATTYATTIIHTQNVVNIPYVAAPDIIYYSEGEGSHAKQQTPANPENHSMGNIVNNMASNAGNARDRGLTVCNLPAGAYKITAKIVKAGDNKLGRAFNLRSGSTILASIDGNSEGVKSSYFILDEDKTNLIINGANHEGVKSLQMQDVDYFYISDLSHLEKELIKNADCTNNDGWPGDGRRQETMEAYNGESRSVFGSHARYEQDEKNGQRSQGITLPLAGLYKLTTYCKIQANTGYVTMWVGDEHTVTTKVDAKNMYLVNTDGSISKTVNSDGNGWVANEVVFSATAMETKTIIMNISSYGNPYTDYAYVSGMKLEYLSEPSVTVTVPEAVGMTTFTTTYAMDFSNTENLKAYKVTSANENYVHLEEVGQVPATTPLFLIGETEKVSVLVNASAVEANMLVPCTEQTIVNKADDGTNYVFAYSASDIEGTKGFYSIGTKSATVPAGKSYLHVPGTEGNSRLMIDFDKETGISSIETEDGYPSYGKFLENGKIVIVKNGVHYIINGLKK